MSFISSDTKKICAKYAIQMKIWDKYTDENSELSWE